MTSTRTYKSGSGFALWRWTYTPSGYITRLHIFKTPWFALVMHWINGPDPEPDPHDHPVTFFSLILRGWYVEERGLLAVPRTYIHIWYNFIRATDIHRIVYVHPKTITLCFMGPKVREWGFWPKGVWTYWKEYNKKYRQETSTNTP